MVISMQSRPYKLPLQDKGKNWRGLYFDGVASYAYVPSNTTINLDSSYTFLAALKVNNMTINPAQFIWSKYAANLSGALGVLNATDDKITSVVYRLGAGAVHYDSPIVKNKMALIGWSYDKPAQKSRIYYNGIASEQTAMGTMGSNTNVSLAIGTNNAANGNFFKGILFCLIYIKETLTKEQMEDILLGRTSPKRLDVRICHDYRLGHGKDLSGNGNDAVLSGTRWV